MVGIAKKSGSIFDSEVYREMERQAVRKGFFKPSEKQMVKMASQQVTIKKEAKATGNLMVDVAVLADKLRERGYVKRAQELEKKLVLFKQAEVHLYHVHDEEGEDVLNWAHREGDVEVAPAKEDYGRVETVQSAAKKILEIVKKQPTGKVASAAVRKTAQDLALKPIEEQSADKVRAIYDQVKQAAARVNTLRGPFAATADQFTEMSGQSSTPAQNALYGKYLNVDGRQIPVYWRALRLFNSPRPPNWNQLSDWANKSNPATINNVANQLGVDVSAAVNDRNWDEVARLIKWKIDSLYNLLWGNNKQSTGVAAIKRLAAAALDEITSEAMSENNIVSADGSINVDGALSNLQSYNMNINNIINKSENWNALRNYWKTLYEGAPGTGLNEYNKWLQEFNAAAVGASRSLGELGNIAGGTVVGLVGPIGQELMAWKAAFESAAPNSEERSNAKASFDGLRKLYNVLRQTDNKEFTQAMPMIQTLADIDPRLNVRSLKDLTAVIQAIAAESKANRGAK